MFPCIAPNNTAEVIIAKELPYFLSTPIRIPRKANSSANAGVIAVETTYRILVKTDCDEVSISGL